MDFLELKSVLRRACLIGGIVTYGLLYNWLYANWLAPTFSYMGMTYREPGLLHLALAWLLALLPACWLPIRLSRPSQVPLWVIYLLVYIPSLFSPLFMARETGHDLLTLMGCLFAGMTILSLINFLPPVRISQNLISPSFFWTAIALLTVGLDLWVLAIFHSRMHLVGFADVYELRSSTDELASGTGVGYAVMLLSSIINPLYMAYGLVSRRKSLLVIGFLNQLFLYTTGGSKAVILSVFMLVGLYFIIGRLGRYFALRLVAAVTSVLVVLCLIAIQKNVSTITQMAISILFMRTFANGGYMTGLYASFFQTHPLTYLSSVHGIDKLIHYPYARTIALEMGWYEMGIPDLDLNAHFWATDGIAAFGPAGIILASLLCALVFWILDSASARHNTILVALTVAFVTVNLANASLFTTLISGGLALLIVLLLFMPAAEETGSLPEIDDRETEPSVA